MDIGFHSRERQRMNGNFHESNPFLSEWRKIFATREKSPALLGPEGDGLRSFGELNCRAEGWAEKLGKVAGRPRVLLVLENGPDWVEVFLGAWMAGGVVVPCEPSLGSHVLREIEDLCGITNTITAESGKISIADCEGAGGGTFPEADLLKVTSGTSSKRRAVAFTAGQLLADATNLHAAMGFREDDKNLGLISFAHSYGFSNLVGMLCCFGVPVVPFHDALPRALGRAIRTSGATVFPGVPAMYRGLTGTGFRSDTLRLCISAGAALAGKDGAAFLGATGLKIHSFYGASECGGICYDDSADIPIAEGFVGKPVPGVSVSPLQNDRPGPVVVGGAAVGLGYLPSRAGDLLTGDRYQPPDILEKCGGGFRILGRDSDFINVGGRKINPVEIENVLREHPAVVDVAVFGIPDSGSRGEVVAACLLTEACEQSLRQHCGQRVPTWQIPRRWFFVDEMPVSARGKVSRTDLRERFVDL
jgi:acyl-CoA synthetase (AMP-forming)/AMP-acid ligase II